MLSEASRVVDAEMSDDIDVLSQSALRILCDQKSHRLLRSRFQMHWMKLSRLLTQLLTLDDAIFKTQARGSAIC